jgi:hypothetical protein
VASQRTKFFIITGDKPKPGDATKPFHSPFHAYGTAFLAGFYWPGLAGLLAVPLLWLWNPLTGLFVAAAGVNSGSQ